MRPSRLPLRIVVRAVSISLFLSAGGCGGEPAPAPSSPPPRAVTATPPSLTPSSPLPSIDETALDPSVAPCDDFFHYACGGWLKANPIPDDRVSWGRGSQLALKNLERLRAILERDADGKGRDDAYADKLGDFYAACMDEAGIEKRGTSELKPELDAIAGGHDPRSLGKLLARLHLLGVFALFNVDAEPDYQESTRNTLSLYQGGLGLPDRDYYFDDPAKPDPRKKEVRAFYEGHVAAMLGLAGDPPARAKAQAAAVMRIETKLAAASLTNVAMRDPHNRYHRQDRAWLKANAPAVDWDAYFAELGLGDLAELNVGEPDFLKAESDAVRKMSAGDLRTYLRWHLLHGLSPYLPARFVDEDFKYRQKLGGAKTIEPRWKRCIHEIDDGMGEALARPFVREVLGEDGKAAAREVVDAVARAMQDNLAHLAWMDETTRAAAIAKIAAMRKKIGYPDKWRNYDALSMTRDSYLTDAERAATFEVRRRLAKVGKPVDPAEWSSTPVTVDAWYEPTHNDITFPAGILQPPFFGLSMTRAMRFGAAGTIVGHEVTHGFDDEGRQFDGAGNMKDWWSPGVAGEFKARAQCIVDQYDAYTVLGSVHVNGKLTLGENIADLGGAKLAYAAFQADSKAHPTTDRFATPPERQFFVTYGQEWCRAIRDEQLHTMVSTDPHSPPMYRINGVLSNTPEFAAAFQCKPGDRMVAGRPCQVW